MTQPIHTHYIKGTNQKYSEHNHHPFILILIEILSNIPKIHTICTIYTHNVSIEIQQPLKYPIIILINYGQYPIISTHNESIDLTSPNSIPQLTNLIKHIANIASTKNNA